MSATTYSESDFNARVNNGAAVADQEAAILPVPVSSIKDRPRSNASYPIAFGLIGMSVFSVAVWVGAVWVVLH